MDDQTPPPKSESQADPAALETQTSKPPVETRSTPPTAWISKALLFLVLPGLIVAVAGFGFLCLSTLLLAVPASIGAVLVVGTTLGILFVVLPLTYPRWGVRNEKSWKGPTEVIACVVFALAVTLVAPVAAVRAFEGSAKSMWLDERTAFSRGPDGFAELKSLARDQYGLTLELGDLGDSYLATTHHGPQSSFGLMTMYPGYCEMGSWPTAINLSYPPLRGDVKVTNRRVVFAVALHELGHCVDMARDQASFGDPHVGRSSIAPSDRASVHDIESFRAAEKSPPTMLWREVYADLFAIGYTRLLWPAAEQGAFARLQRHVRVARSQDDPTHATTCWLDSVSVALPPRDLADLPRWAEEHRRSAACPLGLPAPKATSNAQE